jgi:hypothetical protein
MPASEPGFRMLAHRAAVIIGIVSGFLLFRLGLQALFSVNRNDTWLTILTAVVTFYPLLPLSVLGIFKQRAAARGLTISLLFSLLGITVLSLQPLHKIEWSVSAFAPLFLYFIAPAGSVAALLFYSSGHTSNAVKSGDTHLEPARMRGGISLLGHSFKLSLSTVAVGRRRKEAQWAAIVLGLIAGASYVPWTVFSLMRSIRIMDWLGVAFITATGLTLFPLSVLAIFKPRPAARALVVSLAVTVVYSLVVSPSGPGLAATSRFPYLLFSLPQVLVVGLLFYAISGRNHMREQPEAIRED